LKYLAALFSQPANAERQEKKVQDHLTKPTKPVSAVLSVRDSGAKDNMGANCSAPEPSRNQRPHERLRADGHALRVGIANERCANPQTSHDQIESAVAAEIRRVEPQARSLGWSQWRLWESRFWPGPRGLAALMEPGDQIMEVTTEWIRIQKRHGIQQRFFHFDG